MGDRRTFAGSTSITLPDNELEAGSVVSLQWSGSRDGIVRTRTPRAIAVAAVDWRGGAIECREVEESKDRRWDGVAHPTAGGGLEVPRRRLGASSRQIILQSPDFEFAGGGGFYPLSRSDSA